MFQQLSGINITDCVIQSSPSGGLRLVTDKKQEDLLDLITALLKLNCFLITTVAKQCTFFYNPGFIISSAVL